MKFKVMMKDPDGVYESIAIAARESVSSVKGISNNERDDLKESRREELEEFADKWLDYSECVTLEFDTEANTCVVVPRS